MKKRYIPCIIDTDPGVDDSAALSLSFYDEEIDIKLVTTVAGNLDINTVTRNTMHILEKFKLENKIPLAVGAGQAMHRVSTDARFIHQYEGMGGYIPPRTVKTKPVKESAVDAMYSVIKENKNEIVIIALGPHTNLGHLISKYPDVVTMIKHIYCEGCAPYGYKDEAYISFNVSRDPEAFKLVIESGIPITIIPSRMGRELANFSEEEVYHIRDINDTGRWIYEMYGGYWEPKYPDRRIATNDTCACMALKFPKLFKTRKTNINVDTEEMPGKTVMDWDKKGNINYAYKVNRKKLHHNYFNAVAKFDRFKFYYSNGTPLVDYIATYKADPRGVKVSIPEDTIHMIPSEEVVKNVENKIIVSSVPTKPTSSTKKVTTKSSTSTPKKPTTTIKKSTTTTSTKKATIKNTSTKTASKTDTTKSTTTAKSKNTTSKPKSTTTKAKTTTK